MIDDDTTPSRNGPPVPVPRYRVRLARGAGLVVSFLTERGARTRAALEAARHPRDPAPIVEVLDALVPWWLPMPADPPGDPYPDPGSPYIDGDPYADARQGDKPARSTRRESST